MLKSITRPQPLIAPGLVAEATQANTEEQSQVDDNASVISVVDMIGEAGGTARGRGRGGALFAAHIKRLPAMKLPLKVVARPLEEAAAQQAAADKKK